MKFIYGCDGLGDKLTGKNEFGTYTIRPVLYVGDTAEPATFEDFDRHGLYVLRDGTDEHLQDFDTVAEAISQAEEYSAY